MTPRQIQLVLPKRQHHYRRYGSPGTELFIALAHRQADNLSKLDFDLRALHMHGHNLVMSSGCFSSRKREKIVQCYFVDQIYSCPIMDLLGNEMCYLEIQLASHKKEIQLTLVSVVQCIMFIG